MAHLRSQEIGDTSVTLVAADGTTVTITKEQVQTFYQTTNGNAASRKAQTVAWIKSQLETGLGSDYVSALLMNVDLDTVSGKINLLELFS